MEDSWIRQIEGPNHVYEYLQEYQNSIQGSKEMPLLLDVFKLFIWMQFWYRNKT